MSGVHEMDCLGEETVPVFGRSGAQSSVASTRRQQFKEGVCWCAGCVLGVLGVRGVRGGNVRSVAV